MHAQTPETQEKLTSAEALQVLKDGNARFCESRKADRDLIQQVNETSGGQWPFAVVLSCICLLYTSDAADE